MLWEYVVCNFTVTGRQSQYRSLPRHGDLIAFTRKSEQNRSLGLHTLCLLEIREKEPSLESLCWGCKVYEPPRFMTINKAIEQLLEVERMRGEDAYNEGIACVGLAQLGTEDQRIVAASMSQLLVVDFGPPLHCLVIVGQTHPMEEEMLDCYRLVGS